jgi:hypothetical protein
MAAGRLAVREMTAVQTKRRARARQSYLSYSCLAHPVETEIGEDNVTLFCRKTISGF